MSKYQFTESDIYLPGTGIPRNRLGIETPELLNEVEQTLLQQAYSQFIAALDSTTRFDEDYFRSLHREDRALPDKFFSAAGRTRPTSPVSIGVNPRLVFKRPTQG